MPKLIIQNLEYLLASFPPPTYRINFRRLIYDYKKDEQSASCSRNRDIISRNSQMLPLKIFQRILAEKYQAQQKVN